MTRFLLLAMLAMPLPVVAQEEGQAGTPPQRVRSVLLYGEDACPKPTDPDEIVVCAKVDESPYRIPKKLRESRVTPDGTSWVRRAEMIDEVNRVGIPGSCSPIGTFGQSGCTLQSIQQWAAEKKAQKARDARVP